VTQKGTPNGTPNGTQNGTQNGTPRIFGTDGVRGLANGAITAELAVDLGAAAARVLVDHGAYTRQRPVAVVGRDTRISGQFLEHAVVAGLASAGVDVIRLRVLPTPGVAYLTDALGADVGAERVGQVRHPGSGEHAQPDHVDARRRQPGHDGVLEELPRDARVPADDRHRTLARVGAVVHQHARGGRAEVDRELGGDRAVREPADAVGPEDPRSPVLRAVLRPVRCPVRGPLLGHGVAGPGRISAC
jgi:hypothetical protein